MWGETVSSAARRESGHVNRVINPCNCELCLSPMPHIVVRFILAFSMLNCVCGGGDELLGDCAQQA